MTIGNNLGYSNAALAQFHKMPISQHWVIWVLFRRNACTKHSMINNDIFRFWRKLDTPVFNFYMLSWQRIAGPASLCQDGI